MKKYILFFIAFSMSVFSFSSFAATDDGVVDWKNIIVLGNYNSQTDILTLTASLAETTSPANTHTLGLSLDGKNYRKEFVYSPSKDMYQVVFTHKTSSLKPNYLYSLSVKNVQYKEVYSGSGKLVFSTGGTMTSTGTTLTPGTKNPVSVSEVVKVLVSDMLKTATTLTQKAAYLDSKIRLLQGYKKLYPTKITLIDQIITELEKIKTSLGTSSSGTGSTGQGFIPKYKTRDQEPAKINGIGNKKGYSSWRVPR